MTRNSWAALAAAGSLSLSVTSIVSAQTPAPKVSDQHVQELVRAAALRAGVQGRLDALPGSAAAQSTPTGSGPALPLTLDDAIKLALDRNLDIAVQRLNPQTFDFSIAALRATYAPTLTSTVSAQSTTTASTQTISGAAVGTGTSNAFTNWNGGIAKTFNWGGGSVAATLNNSRQTSNSPNFLYQTLYSPTGRRPTRSR